MSLASAAGKATSRSFLLELPIELRLSIYDFALADSDSITITSAPVAGDDPSASGYIPRNAIPGLPPNHIPVVKSSYDASLLSIENPIELPKAKQHAGHGYEALPHPTPLALLQTSRQVNAEVASHIKFRAPKATSAGGGGISLYISYPHGLLVLKACYPSLLRQARNVYMAGYYNLKSAAPSISSSPTSSNASMSSNSSSSEAENDSTTLSRTSRSVVRAGVSSRRRHRIRLSSPPRSRTTPPDSKLYKAHLPSTLTFASAAMKSLVLTLLPPERGAEYPNAPLAPPVFKSLTLRIYYPDECAYSQVWSDEGSPLIDTLRNTCGGLIDMEVWRGRKGCGIAATVRPSPGARVVSTVWRRFEEAFGGGMVRGPRSDAKAREWVLGNGGGWGISE